MGRLSTGCAVVAALLESFPDRELTGNVPEKEIGMSCDATPKDILPQCTIYVWADYTWCYWSELEEMLQFMSDDYMEVTIPEGYSGSEDDFLAETRPQG